MYKTTIKYRKLSSNNLIFSRISPDHIAIWVSSRFDNHPIKLLTKDWGGGGGGITVTIFAHVHVHTCLMIGNIYAIFYFSLLRFLSVLIFKHKNHSLQGVSIGNCMFD